MKWLIAGLAAIMLMSCGIDAATLASATEQSSDGGLAATPQPQVVPSGVPSAVREVEAAVDEETSDLQAESAQIDIDDLCESQLLSAEGIGARFYLEPADFESTSERLRTILERDATVAYDLASSEQNLESLAESFGMTPEQLEFLGESNGILELTRRDGAPLDESDPLIRDLIADRAVFAHVLATWAVEQSVPVAACY